MLTCGLLRSNFALAIFFLTHDGAYRERRSHASPLEPSPRTQAFGSAFRRLRCKRPREEGAVAMGIYQGRTGPVNAAKNGARESRARPTAQSSAICPTLRSAATIPQTGLRFAQVEEANAEVCCAPEAFADEEMGKSKPGFRRGRVFCRYPSPQSLPRQTSGPFRSGRTPSCRWHGLGWPSAYRWRSRTSRRAVRWR